MGLGSIVKVDGSNCLYLVIDVDAAVKSLPWECDSQPAYFVQSFSISDMTDQNKTVWECLKGDMITTSLDEMKVQLDTNLVDGSRNIVDVIRLFAYGQQQKKKDKMLKVCLCFTCRMKTFFTVVFMFCFPSINSFISKMDPKKVILLLD